MPGSLVLTLREAKTQSEAGTEAEEKVGCTLKSRVTDHMRKVWVKEVLGGAGWGKGFEIKV